MKLLHGNGARDAGPARGARVGGVELPVDEAVERHGKRARNDHAHEDEEQPHEAGPRLMHRSAGPEGGDEGERQGEDAVGEFDQVEKRGDFSRWAGHVGGGRLRGCRGKGCHACNVPSANGRVSAWRRSSGKNWSNADWKPSRWTMKSSTAVGKFDVVTQAMAHAREGQPDAVERGVAGEPVVHGHRGDGEIAALGKAVAVGVDVGVGLGGEKAQRHIRISGPVSPRGDGRKKYR